MLTERRTTTWNVPEGGVNVFCFAFNGQEKTDEISGVGNHTAALYWEYDTRLGRRWNLDPKPVAWESGYAVNKNNPLWYSDPLGDLGKNGEERRKEKAEKKFDQKVSQPLKEMETNGATPNQIQAEANRLVDKYQNKRWLHYSYGVANPNNPSDKSYTSTATGMQHQQKIGIKAYQTTTTNAQINSNRPTDGSMVTTGNTGLIAPAGSTVNVQFDPYSQPNALNVATTDPSGGSSVIATTGGMITNITGTNIYTRQTVITTTNAGQVQYIVQNSNLNQTIDNWQLNIQVTSPPVLNPIPLIVSNYPFYK